MKKLIFSAAILFSCTVLSFATNPKGEAREPNTAAPTETTVNVKTSHTYWIISQSGSDYVLSNTPSDLCGSGQEAPCKITTEGDFSSTMTIDKAKVDLEDEVIIEERRLPLN